MLFVANIIKLNDVELPLAINIKNENANHTGLICKAIFKFDLK